MTLDFAERWFERAIALREALADLTMAYAPIIDGRRSSGGDLALARAFKVLGWDDPQAAQLSEICQEPGCGRRWSYVDVRLDLKLCEEHWKSRQ